VKATSSAGGPRLKAINAMSRAPRLAAATAAAPAPPAAKAAAPVELPTVLRSVVILKGLFDQGAGKAAVPR
jgi:hypothetical protein